MPSAPSAPLPASAPAAPTTDSLELQRHYVEQSRATLNDQQPRSAEPQYSGQAGVVAAAAEEGSGARRRYSEGQQQHHEDDQHSTTQLRRLSSGDPEPLRHSFVAYDPTRPKQQQKQGKASSPDLTVRLKLGPIASPGVSNKAAAPRSAVAEQYASWPTSRPSSSSGGGGEVQAMSSLNSSTSSLSPGMIRSTSTDQGIYQIARIHPDTSSTYPPSSNGTGQSAYHMAVSGAATPANVRSTHGQSAWSAPAPTSTSTVTVTTTTTTSVPHAPAPMPEPKDFTLEQMCESRTYIVAKAQAFGQQGGFLLVTALFDPLLQRFQLDKLPTSDDALLRFAPDMMPVAGTRPKDFLMIWRMWVDWTEQELRIPTIPLVAPLVALFLLDKIVSMDDRTRLVQILDLYRQAAYDVTVTLGGNSPADVLPQWKPDQWQEWFAMLQTGRTSLFDWRCIREACGMGLTARATPAAPPQSSIMSVPAPPTVPMIAGPGFAPTIGPPPLAAPPPGAQYVPPAAPAFPPPVPMPLAPSDAWHYAQQPQPSTYPMHHPTLVQMAAAHPYPQPAQTQANPVRPPSAHVPQRAASFSQGQQSMAPAVGGESALRQSVPASSMAATGGQSMPPRPPSHPAGAKSLPISPQVSPQAQFARPLSSGSGLARGPSSSPAKAQQRPPSPPATSTLLSGFQAKPSSSTTQQQQQLGSVSPAQSASGADRTKAPFATGSRGSSNSAAVPRSAPPTAGSFAEALQAEILAAAGGGAPIAAPSSEMTPVTFTLPSQAQASAAPLPVPHFAPVPLARSTSASGASMDPPQSLGKRKRTVQETVEAWKRIATEKPLNNGAVNLTPSPSAVRSPGALTAQGSQPNRAPIQQTAAAHRRDSGPISPSGLVVSKASSGVSSSRDRSNSAPQSAAAVASQPRRRKTSHLKQAPQELKGIALPGDENMTDEGFDKVVAETLEAVRGFERARAEFSAAWTATPARAGEALPPIARIRQRAPGNVISASPWRDGKKQFCPSKSASLDLEATFGDYLPLPGCSSALPAPNIAQSFIRVSDPIYIWRPFPTVGANNQPPPVDLTYTAKPCPATGPLHDILFLTPRLFLPWPKALTPISSTHATSSHAHLKSLEMISRKRIDAEILEGRQVAGDDKAYAAAVQRHLFYLVYGAIKDGKMNGLGNLKAPRLANTTRKKVAQIMAEGNVLAPTPPEGEPVAEALPVAAAPTPTRGTSTSTGARITKPEDVAITESGKDSSNVPKPTLDGPAAVDKMEKVAQLAAASSNSPVTDKQVKLKSALKSLSSTPTRPVSMFPAASAPPATAPSSAAAMPNASPAPSKARRPSLAGVGTSASSPAVPGVAPGARPRAKSMGGRRVSTGPGVHPLAQIYAVAPNGLRQQLRELSADVRGVPSDSAAAVLAAAAKKIQPAARRALSMTASPRLASGKELAHPSPPLVPIPLAGEPGSGEASHGDKGKGKEKQGSVEPPVPKKGSALGVLLDEEIVPDSAAPGSPVAGASSATGASKKFTGPAPSRPGDGRDAIVVPDSAAPGSPIGSTAKSVVSPPASSRFAEKHGAAALEVDSPDIPPASLGKTKRPTPHRPLFAGEKATVADDRKSPDVPLASPTKGKQSAVESAADTEMPDAAPVPAPSPAPSAGSSFASAFSSVARAAGGALASAARAFLPGSAAPAAIELEADEEESASPTRTKATTPTTVPTSTSSADDAQSQPAAEDPQAGAAEVVKAPPIVIEVAVPKPIASRPLNTSSLPPLHMPVEPLRPCAVRELARSKAHWLKASEPYRPFGPFLS